MPPYALPSYDDFVRALTPWFASVQLPAHLHRALYDKLERSVFDSGDSFQLTKVQCPEEVSAAEEEEDHSGGDEPDSHHTQWVKEENEDGEDPGAAGGHEPVVDAAQEGGPELEEEVRSQPGYLLLAKRDLPAYGDVWLVDHAVTFSDLDELAGNLAQSPELCDRVEELLRLEPLPLSSPNEDGGTAEEELVRQRQSVRVSRILSSMWRGVGSYSLPGPHGQPPKACWYFLDEVGSAIMPFSEGDAAEGGAPMMRVEVLPLALPPSQLVFSVMWCVDDVPEASLVVCRATYRPYWQTGGRDAHSIMTEPACARVLTEVLYGSYGTEIYRNSVGMCVAAYRQAQRAAASLPPDASSDANEPVPRGQHTDAASVFADKQLVKVYTDDTAIANALRTHAADAFEIVTTPSAADAVWINYGKGLTRFAGGPGSTKRAFPGAKCLSSFPALDACLATPATWGAWMCDNITPTPSVASSLPIVYRGTACDLCALAGEFLTREAFLLLARASNDAEMVEAPSALVTCACEFVSRDSLSQLRCRDGVNAWYGYALPHTTAETVSGDGGDAHGRPLVESGDLAALLKLAEPLPMVYMKHMVNTVRLPEFPARQVTLKFFVAVRALGGVDSAPDIGVCNEYVAVLKPDVVGGKKLAEDAEQVSRTLASLSEPFKFVGTGAPVRQALWVNSSVVEERARAMLCATPDAWEAVLAQVLHVLRTVVPPLASPSPSVNSTSASQGLVDDELKRRRAILCATFLLCHNDNDDDTQPGIRPVLVNIRNGTDYGSVSHVSPTILPALFRAVLLGHEANMTPL